MKRWYVGYANGGRWPFKSASEPTTESHGDKYAAVLGPMTKRAAEWASRQHHSNPHFQTVADAERISAEEAA